MKKVNIIKAEYSNNGKQTDCIITAKICFKEIFKHVENSEEFSKYIISCDFFKKFIKKYENNIELYYINPDNLELIIKYKGKSICHDDDGFDEDKGKKISYLRAIKKLYKWYDNLIYVFKKDIYSKLNFNYKKKNYKTIDDKLAELCDYDSSNPYI